MVSKNRPASRRRVGLRNDATGQIVREYYTAIFSQSRNYKADYGKPTNFHGEMRR